MGVILINGFVLICNLLSVIEIEEWASAGTKTTIAPKRPNLRCDRDPTLLICNLSSTIRV